MAHADCTGVAVTAPSSDDSFTYQIQFHDTTATTFTMSSFTSDNLDCFSQTMRFIQPNNATQISNNWALAVNYDSNQRNKLQVFTTDNNDESYGDSIGWLYIVELTYENVQDSSITATHNIKLEILANCSIETINQPVLNFTNDTYTIYDDPKIIYGQNMYGWTTSRESCQVSQYTILTNGYVRTNFATIVPNEDQIQIYSQSNYFGGALRMQYGGLMNSTVWSFYTFYIQTTRVCNNETDFNIYAPQYLYGGIVYQEVYPGPLNHWRFQYKLGTSDCAVGYNYYFKNNHTQLPTDGSTVIDQYSQYHLYFTVNAQDNHADYVEKDHTNLIGIELYTIVFNYWYNAPNIFRNNSDLQPIRVYIYPNCLYETVSLVSSINDTQYSIHTGPKIIQIPEMATSHSYCYLNYEVTVDGFDVNSSGNSSYQDLLTFNQSTMQLTVDVADNQYANHQLNIIVKGFNTKGNYNTDSFVITLMQNCEFATISTSVNNAVQGQNYYNYTVGSGLKDFYAIDGTSSDPYCGISYGYYFVANNTELPTSNTDSAIIRSSINTDKFFRINCDDKSQSYVETDLQNQEGIQIQPYLYITEHPSTLVNLTNQTITVFIIPDCTQEQISTTDTYTDLSYQAMTGSYTLPIHNFETSLPFCIIYEVKIQVNQSDLQSSSLHPMVAFDDSTMILSMDITDNQFCGQSFNVDIVASNIGNISISQSFLLTILANCKEAKMIPTNFDDASLNQVYIIENSMKELLLQRPSSDSAQCCTTLHKLLFRSTQGIMTPTTYTEYTAVQNVGFIESFDPQPNNSIIQIQIYTTDQSFMDNYESISYDLKVLSYVEDFESTINTSSETSIIIKSYCVNTIFTNTTHNYDYMIRQGIKTLSVPQIEIKWLDDLYNQTYIIERCGNPVINIWNQSDGSNLTNNLVDSIISSISQNIGNGYTYLTVESENPWDGGSNQNGTYQDFKNNEIYFEIYLSNGRNGYQESKGYQNITITAKDNCWHTQIQEGVQKLSNNVQNQIFVEKIETFNKFTDSVTTIYSDNQYYPQLGCGDLQYELVQLESSQTQYTQLDQIWNNGVDGQITNYLQLDSQSQTSKISLQVLTYNESLIGFNYKFAVFASFVREQQYPNLYKEFIIEFVACQVTSILDTSVVQNIYYNLFGPKLRQEIDYTQLAQVPECYYHVEYTTLVANNEYQSLPINLTFVYDTIDEEESMYYEVDYDDISLKDRTKEFILRVQFYQKYTQSSKILNYQEDIKWNIRFAYFPYNEEPQYDKFGSSVKYVTFGETIQFSTGKPTEDVVEAKWEVEDESMREKFDEFAKVTINEDFSIDFKVKPFSIMQLGTYGINIKIKDNDPPEAKVKIYNYFVIVYQEFVFSENDSQKDDKIELKEFNEQLTYKIDELDAEGNVIIKFSHKMNQTNFQILKSIDFKDLQKLLMITILPAPEQDPSKLEINHYQITKYDDQYLHISLNFTNPQYISASSSLDQLMVNFIEPEAVKSAQGQILSKYEVIFPFLNKQLEPGQSFIKTAIQIQEGMQSMAIGSLVLNTVWQLPINYVWGMINVLQITAHCQLVNAKVPANLGVFNNITMKLIYFDILPEEGLEYFYLWKLNDGTYLNYQDVSGIAIQFQNQSNRRILNQNQGSQKQNFEDQIDQSESSKQIEDSDDLCLPGSNDFCTLSFKLSKGEKIDQVIKLLNKRGIANQYTEVQIEALAGYEQKVGSNYVTLTELQKMAYGSTSIIENMGTIFVIWTTFFLYVLLIAICNCICCFLKKMKRYNKCYRGLMKRVFWGSIIRFGLEVYMEVAIAAQINIKDFLENENLYDSNQLHNRISLYFAIALGFFILIFPLISGAFLLVKRKAIILDQKNSNQYLLNHYSTEKSLNQYDQKFVLIAKFSILFKDINTNKYSQLLFYPLFMLRRFCLAVILVQIQDYPSIQTILIILLNVTQIIYLGYEKPWALRRANRLELFGEMMNMLICYNLFVFSDFVPELDTRSNYAFVSIFLMTLMIITNMFVVIIDFALKGIRYYQRRILQKESKKRIDEFNESVAIAKQDQDKRIQELISVAQNQQFSNISIEQRKEITRALMNKSASPDIRYKDKIYNDFEWKYENSANQIEFMTQFHTARYGYNNRFASLVGKRVQKEELNNEVQKIISQRKNQQMSEHHHLNDLITNYTNSSEQIEDDSQKVQNKINNKKYIAKSNRFQKQSQTNRSKNQRLRRQVQLASVQEEESEESHVHNQPISQESKSGTQNNNQEHLKTSNMKLIKRQQSFIKSSKTVDFRQSESSIIDKQQLQSNNMPIDIISSKVHNNNDIENKNNSKDQGQDSQKDGIKYEMAGDVRLDDLEL